MLIEQIHVKNFRSARDVLLDCSSLTALVGPNGSGKSTLLRALEAFYATATSLDPDDFYASDTSAKIEISITYGSLGVDAAARFSSYAENGKLTITRVFSVVDRKVISSLHGSRLQNPDFTQFRVTLSTEGKQPAREIYAQIRARPEYSSLPPARSAEECVRNLEAWEVSHPTSCLRMRDDGQFFGFKEVGLGYLGEFTRLVFVPAVRDAYQDGSDGRGSVISQILDLVVRSRLEAGDDFRRLIQETSDRYRDVMALPATREQLSEIEHNLSQTLAGYVPSASIRLDWMTEGGVEITLPKANVRLVEDSYVGPINRCGHGLQRAFILSMLQQLAAVRHLVDVPPDADPSANGVQEEPANSHERCAPARALPALVLAIEEPELYQHPNRQRFLARVLLNLTAGALPGVASTCQVLYATHSPLFVGIDRFDLTRVVRKLEGEAGRPRRSVVSRTTLDAVAADLWEACNRQDAASNTVAQFTGEGLRARLQPIMTPWMAEGFFADAVVLVEGESDLAALRGAASVLELDLDGLGIAVIPAMGKSNIDRPALIFRALGIPVYIVWDGDRGDQGGVRANQILQRIVGISNPVDYPTQAVCPTYSSLDHDLETVIKAEIGERFGSLLDECRNDFGYGSRADAAKNPRVMSEFLQRAKAEGFHSPTLEGIIQHACEMASRAYRLSHGPTAA